MLLSPMDKNLITALLAESPSFRNFAAEIVFNALQPDLSLVPKEVSMVREKFKAEGKIPAIKYLRDLSSDRAVADYFVKAFPRCVAMASCVFVNYGNETTLGLALSKYIVEEITKDL